MMMRMVACRCGDFSNLARHKLTHTDDRPFDCHLCDYSASQYGTLRGHGKRADRRKHNFSLLG